MAHANTVSKLQAVLIGAEAAHLHAMLDAGYKPAQIIRSYLVPVLSSHFIDEMLDLPLTVPDRGWDDENQAHQFKVQSRWQDRAYVINNPEFN